MSFDGKGIYIMISKTTTEVNDKGKRINRHVFRKQKTANSYHNVRVEIRGNKIICNDDKNFNQNFIIGKKIKLKNLFESKRAFSFEYTSHSMNHDHTKPRFYKNKSVVYINLKNSEDAEKFKNAFDQTKRELRTGLISKIWSFKSDDKKSSVKTTKPSTREKIDAKSTLEEPKKPGKNPEIYLCPITSQFMSDPVITPSGNSFEREAIEKSIAISGVCPLTREPLKFDQLIPNRALKQMIDQWKLENVDASNDCSE